MAELHCHQEHSSRDAFELAQSVGWAGPEKHQFVSIEPDVFSVVFSGEYSSTDVETIACAWETVRSIMTNEMAFPLGRRLLVVGRDEEEARTVQKRRGECVVFFPHKGLSDDVQGLCHELTHSFQIFGRYLIDEGLACLVECLGVHNADEKSHRKIAKDIRLSGFHAASDHSLALTAFSTVFLQGGWRAVRLFLYECLDLDDEELRSRFVKLCKQPVESKLAKTILP